MKTISILLLLFLTWVPAFTARGQVAEGQEMITLPGDGRVHELTLNTQVVTTVTLPGTITLVTGYGMVLSAEEAKSLVESEKLSATISTGMNVQPVTMVHYAQASTNTLALRAVRRGTPCYLTVRCDSQIFLFKLLSGEHANLAVIVQETGVAEVSKIKPVKPKDVVKSRIAFSAAELVGILSKAKERAFLQTVNPGLYVGWKERRGLELKSTHGPITSTITEIQQWPEKDAIVLRAKLSNAAAQDFRFSPAATKVRVGDRSYNVQLADGTGLAPAGSTTLLDVVLQGNSGGGREHLSLENDFILEVAEDKLPPPPQQLFPPSPPLLPTVGKTSSGQVPTVIDDTGLLPISQEPGDIKIQLPNLYPDK
jgi:hypothetical protein